MSNCVDCRDPGARGMPGGLVGRMVGCGVSIEPGALGLLTAAERVHVSNGMNALELIPLGGRCLTPIQLRADRVSCQVPGYLFESLGAFRMTLGLSMLQTDGMEIERYAHGDTIYRFAGPPTRPAPLLALRRVNRAILGAG